MLNAAGKNRMARRVFAILRAFVRTQATMPKPRIEFDIADVKKTIARDGDGSATRAIIRCLNDAAAPVSQALRGSLSRDEQRLSQELLRSIEKAERALTSAWEQEHSGRRL